MAMVLSDAQIEESLPRWGAGWRRPRDRKRGSESATSVSTSSSDGGSTDSTVFAAGRRGRTRSTACSSARKRSHRRSAEILGELRRATGRWEASFASKLLATVDPGMPVIDSVVLRTLGLRLPPLLGAEDRAAGIEAVHRALAAEFAAFLPTKEGRYLVASFRQMYPHADISEMILRISSCGRHDRRIDQPEADSLNYRRLLRSTPHPIQQRLHRAPALRNHPQRIPAVQPFGSPRQAPT